MAEAQAMHRRGELAAAGAIYQSILQRDARHAKALHLLGVIALQRGQPAVAADLITRAVVENDTDSSAHFDLGCALAELQRTSDSLASFTRAAQLRPSFAQALNNRGNALLTLARPAEALASLDRALVARPRYAQALHNRGNALMALGRPLEALRSYDQALELEPDHVDMQNNRASALRELGRFDEALAVFDRVLAADPRHVGALCNRGNALLELKRTTEALECFDRAREVEPANADVHNRQGHALTVLGRPEEAVESFDRAIAIRPDFAEAFGNRGAALLALHRSAEALASVERSLAYKPDNANALANRGATLLEMERVEEALASLEDALALAPNHAFALNNRAAAFWKRKHYEQAAQDVERLLSIQPDCDYALGFLFNARIRSCDWRDFAELAERIREAVRADRHACRPFSLLPVTDDAVEQRRCAELFVAHECAPAATALHGGSRYEHERIRVAYLSADLHNHATAQLLVEVLERHDRQRFELTAVSFGPPHEDAMRRRLRAAFEHFVDARELSDRAIAETVRTREIDIAIDLKGYTKDARPRIFALRPAPLQVSLLGYPGTTGASYIDYLVADSEVIPPEHEAHYSEHVVYLPDCYQPNDSVRAIAAETPSRAELGLPEQGFVFCCFNNHYKITPAVFACWMHLLREVPGSVLWLLDGEGAATRNLREAARRENVDPARLRFAPRRPLPEHLARHRRADLFLDTLPVNAHTTASDALWAGLPVLTCRGRSFVARVAASLLKAVQLPELVTDSLEDYTARALQLARQPGELGALRERLERQRSVSSLFDAERFRRHFEAALLHMYERHRRGLPPVSFRVPHTPAAP